MLFFRKQPVTIEAHQWFRNGDHPEDNAINQDGHEVEGLLVRYFRHPGRDGQDECGKCGKIMHDHGWVDTLEGGHVVCPGDWIITGVKGEFYPCKPDIFEQTYERVDDWYVRFANDHG